MPRWLVADVDLVGDGDGNESTHRCEIVAVAVAVADNDHVNVHEMTAEATSSRGSVANRFS